MIYDSYDDMRYACIRFARFSKILRNRAYGTQREIFVRRSIQVQSAQSVDI